jgi:hypothetical protein
VRTVVINGRTVMQDGALPGVDADKLLERAQEVFEKMKNSYPERDLLHRSVEKLFPPSFPVI